MCKLNLPWFVVLKENSLRPCCYCQDSGIKTILLDSLRIREAFFLLPLVIGSFRLGVFFAHVAMTWKTISPLRMWAFIWLFAPKTVLTYNKLQLRGWSGSNRCPL